MSNKQLRILFLITISVVVAVVYSPALRGGFVWDDLLLVKENPLVQGTFTLCSIWFQTDFPFAIIFIWLQWLVWGLEPAGYHAVNVAFHLCNAVLLWALLKRITVPGSFLAALLFAVHPVCVASAGWISEIKNTLSLLLYLAAAYFWVCANEEVSGAETIPHAGRGQSAWFYGASLAAFTCALLTKTSTVMFPVSILLWVWWRSGRISRRDVIRVAPFFFLSMVFGLLTVWFQTHQVLRGESVQPDQLLARALLAAKAIWFYAAKALLPVQLNMVYPLWKYEPSHLLTYIPAAALIVAIGLLLRFRNSWGRHALFGAGFFVINLFPVLGFFDMYYLAISRVSDHFQYLPIIGLIALAAAAVSRTPRQVCYAISATAVVLLSMTSFDRARVIATDETLWRDTLSKNPGAWPGHNNLGCIIAERGDLPAAMRHFEEAIRLHPQNASAHANLAQALAAQNRWAEAEAHFRTSLEIKPNSPEVLRNFATALSGQGKANDAAARLSEFVRLQPDADVCLELAGLLLEVGKYREAVNALRKAIELRPGFQEAMNNLAWILATCPDNSVRNGDEAVRLAASLSQADPSAPVFTGTLSAAYAEAGRFQEALTAARKAEELAVAQGDRRFAASIRLLIKSFQQGRPWREGSR